MKKNRHWKIFTNVLFLLVLVATPLIAADVPNFFSPNTGISSNEVNDNFSSLDARLDVLEQKFADMPKAAGFVRAALRIDLINNSGGGSNPTDIELDQANSFVSDGGSINLQVNNVTTAQMTITIDSIEDISTMIPLVSQQDTDSCVVGLIAPSSISLICNSVNVSAGVTREVHLVLINGKDAPNIYQ